MRMTRSVNPSSEKIFQVLPGRFFQRRSQIVGGCVRFMMIVVVRAQAFEERFTAARMARDYVSVYQRLVRGQSDTPLMGEVHRAG